MCPSEDHIVVWIQHDHPLGVRGAPKLPEVLRFDALLHPSEGVALSLNSSQAMAKARRPVAKAGMPVATDVPLTRDVPLGAPRLNQ